VKQILSNQTQNNINGVISYLFGTENLRLHHLRHSLGRHFQPTSLLNLLFHQIGVKSKYKVHTTGEKKTTALIYTCCVYQIQFVCEWNSLVRNSGSISLRFAYTRRRARSLFLFFCGLVEVDGGLFDNEQQKIITTRVVPTRQEEEKKEMEQRSG